MCYLGKSHQQNLVGDMGYNYWTRGHILGLALCEGFEKEKKSNHINPLI